MSLDSEALRPDPELERFDQAALRHQFVVQVGSHSAERKPDEKRAIEAAFREGELPVLFSTSTLEMGVDIGGLDTVLLAGVPPLPSNYAQRAGRAGRGASRTALLVTFCFENKNHDAYYFDHPEQMINGSVSPPAADPQNAEILRRHVNALVLPRYLTDLAQIQHSPERVVADHWQKVQEVLDPPFDVSEYLSKELPDRLTRWLQTVGHVASSEGALRNAMYDSDLLPDYEFRRDQVTLVDAEDASEELSSKDPEQALHHFAPQRLIFLPGERYEVAASDTGYRDVGDGARSYSELLGKRVLDFGPMKRDVPRYQTSTLIQSDEAVTWVFLDGPLRIGLLREARILHVNEGKQTYDTVVPFVDESGESFTMGHESERDIVVVEMDRAVADSATYPVSLLSALDRTIKDGLGLDEGEIQIEFGVTLETSEDAPWKASHTAVLYASNKNGSVPLSLVAENIREHALRAATTIASCACERGCYLCCRSHATQFQAHALRKSTAQMLAEYVAGTAAWDPNISPVPLEYSPDLTLELRRESGDVRVIPSEGKEVRLVGAGNSNEPMFDAVSTAASQVAQPGERRLCLMVPAEKGGHSWQNAFAGGRVGKGKRAYRRAAFELMRFKSIIIVEVDR